MAAKYPDQPPTYHSVSEERKQQAGQSRPVVLKLLQNKPCPSPLDLRSDLPWSESTVIKRTHEVILLPKVYSLDYLHALVRERIEQRFRLECDYDDLQKYLRVKIGSDGYREMATRVLIHDGNYEAAKALLDLPEAALDVWFGEVGKAGGKKRQ